MNSTESAQEDIGFNTIEFLKLPEKNQTFIKDSFSATLETNTSSLENTKKIYKEFLTILQIASEGLSREWIGTIDAIQKIIETEKGNILCFYQKYPYLFDQREDIETLISGYTSEVNYILILKNLPEKGLW